LFKFWQIWTGTEFMGPIAWNQLLKVKIFAGLSIPIAAAIPRRGRDDAQPNQ
jgi:hypothetical protein